MKKTHLMILLVGLVLSPWSDMLAIESVSITKTFASSQTLFANPERGWIVHQDSGNMWGLDTLRNNAEKVSLILIKIDISGYVNSAHIGQTKLDEIRTALNISRTQGLKVIMRSAYAWHETLAPDPKDIQTIKSHVMDMKPIYTEYEDIIIAVEMGMFGPWGEMHSSQHSTINTKMYYPIETSAMKQVHNAYMYALPKRRSVLVRRPYYIRQILNDEKALMTNEAYSDATKARTGYHNDAYLNSKDDGGTFAHGWSRDEELAYINQMTRYTFFGGESFGTPNDVYNNANNAILESKQQHMTYLHRDFYKPIYDAWGDSVKEDFTRKLGYRFELKNMSYSQEVAPGGILNFSLKIRNSGFAAMHLNRPVNLILDNGKTGNARIKYQTTLSVDPRTWTPEADTITIDRKLRIPATINEGIWQLLLSLPDSSTQLQNDGRYAVRFANDNVWNDDGTNLLTKEISISASASGSRTKDNVFKEITNTPTPPISQLNVVKTDKVLILSATYHKDYSFHQAFIDADNNPATGYFVEGIGADFLVENNHYYEHKGSKGSDWLWQHLNGTITYSVDNNRYVWQIPIANLNLPMMLTSKVVFAGTKDDEVNYSSVVSVTTT